MEGKGEKDEDSFQKYLFQIHYLHYLQCLQYLQYLYLQ